MKAVESERGLSTVAYEVLVFGGVFFSSLVFLFRTPSPSISWSSFPLSGARVVSVVQCSCSAMLQGSDYVARVCASSCSEFSCWSSTRKHSLLEHTDATVVKRSHDNCITILGPRYIVCSSSFCHGFCGRKQVPVARADHLLIAASLRFDRVLNVGPRCINRI